MVARRSAGECIHANRLINRKLLEKEWVQTAHTCRDLHYKLPVFTACSYSPLFIAPITRAKAANVESSQIRRLIRPL